MMLRSNFTRFISVSRRIIQGRLPAVLTAIFAMGFLPACAGTHNLQFSETELAITREYSAPGHAFSLPIPVEDTISESDILHLDEDVTAMLDETVMSHSNPRHRLNAIVEILNRKVRWDTDSDRYATQTAMETYWSGTGNCLSFANLFIAMARYAGLEAGYQEVSTGLNWNREGGVLFVSKHISASATIGTRFNSNVELVFTNDNDVVIQATNTYDEMQASGGFLSVLEQEETSSTSIPDSRAFAQYYNNIASMHLAQGEPDLAFKYFFKSIETDPSLDFVWSNLGVAYSRNLQWAASEAAFFNALSIAGDSDDLAVTSIMNNMVKLYERSGYNEKADLYRAKVASFREKNPYYHFLAGQSAFSGASYATSVKFFKEAIKMKKDEDLFYYGLAMAYLKLGDIRKAERNIDKAKYYAWGDQKKGYYGQMLEKISETAVN